MREQYALQTALADELTRIRLRNPSYSLRSFSRRLGVVPSVLSDFLNGKRQVSRRTAEKISDRLFLDPEKKSALFKTFFTNRNASNLQPQVELSMDHFHAISEWYYFAILCLSETENFKSDIEWIADRLGLKRSIVKKAIERLLRLGMLKEKDNKWIATGESYKSPDEIADIAVRKSHIENLELLRNSLENHVLEERDFTATTMVIDPALIPEAKRRIRAFQRELNAFLESGQKKEVYKICNQLIPLTVKEKNQ